MTSPDLDGGDNSYAVASADLRAFIERRERLEEAKAEAVTDIKELNMEVKAKGYDLRTFNEMIRLRAMDVDKRNEREALRNTYGAALGIFD